MSVKRGVELTCDKCGYVQFYQDGFQASTASPYVGVPEDWTHIRADWKGNDFIVLCKKCSGEYRTMVDSFLINGNSVQSVFYRDAIDGYLNHLRNNHRAAETIRTQRSILSNCFNIALSSGWPITESELLTCEYKKYLERSLAEKSVSRYLAAVRDFYKWVLDSGIVLSGFLSGEVRP